MRAYSLWITASLLAASPAMADLLPFSGSVFVGDTSPALLPQSASVSGSGTAFSRRKPGLNAVRTFLNVSGFTGTSTSSIGGTGAPPVVYSLEIDGIGDPRFQGGPASLRGPMPVSGALRTRSTTGGAVLRSFPLTSNGTAGLGLGGTLPGSGSIQSLQFGVWTTGTAAVPGVYTGNFFSPGIGTLSAQGYDLRTVSGVGPVQLVTPMRAVTTGVADRGGVFVLRLFFQPAPEPGQALMLGAGSLAVFWLAARKRARGRV